MLPAPGDLVYVDPESRSFNLWADSGDLILVPGIDAEDEVVGAGIPGDLFIVVGTRDGAIRSHDGQPIRMLLVLGKSGLGWVNASWVELP